MSSYAKLKNLMWPTHDFLLHLFKYKFFLPGSHMLYHNSLKGHNSKTNKNSTLLLGIVGKLSKSTF
ncbi:hypothetical protein O3M35_007034 [Rhynocoris fuscipes]|uniref:Uncharacterized protein n=1 Tax=Rhynocoris fuscipes TaxID=488301 RepID=A0AAW1DHV9_9HEMI